MFIGPALALANVIRYTKIKSYYAWLVPVIATVIRCTTI